MSVSQEVASTESGKEHPDIVFADLLQRWQLSLVLVAFAILQQSLGHHNADNSWLFTVCEKLLDGAQPYVDVIETNPPASFMIYMPAVLLARMIGLPIEFVASVCVFSGVIACILLAGSILRRAGLLRRREAGYALNASVFALLVMPGFSFAEREHLASALILPALALYAARADDAEVHLLRALLAGLLAGIAMAIKPHFAVVVGFPLLTMLIWRRSLAPAFYVENFAAAAVVIAYVVSVFVWFPAFFEVLPSILDAYVPVKEPLRLLLTHTWFLANLLMLAVVARYASERWRDLRIFMLAAASLGFVAAFVMQGKGWVNHGLPGCSLAMLALFLLVAPAVRELAARQPGAEWAAMRHLVMFLILPFALGLPILFGAPAQFAAAEEYPGLSAQVRRLGPPRPRIMALSGDLDFGHPLTRRVGGVWVGQPHSLWLMLSAQVLIDFKRGDAERLKAYIDADARMFAANVRDRAPDIILVADGDRAKRMRAHPEILAAMARYQRVASVPEVEIWAPRQDQASFEDD